MPTHTPLTRREPLSDWLALKKKIKVREAAELNGVSEETFRRHYSHLIKKLSPRRDGVELGDALAIGESKQSI
jgi:DeoR/GlpR family transcriptional regulator of sugar metabolism